MQDTPRGNRLHIAIFGCRNAGKSSLINALTNQSIALVSQVPGTTTDPVYKSMELLPVGPVVIIDTAGIDDVGHLGELRVKKSMEVLNKTDLVLLVIDATRGVTQYDLDLIERCKAKNLPLVAVINKIDLAAFQAELDVPVVEVSARTGQGIKDLKISIVKNAPSKWDDQSIIGDLLQAGDTVVLVVPLDLAAPKGRLILPQVQTIRDILDHGGIAVMARDTELKQTLANLAVKPKMVVTDSQVFKKADADTPSDILLTSFSILFARYKGDLEMLVAGAKAIDDLKPGDKVLVAESCTHHRVEDDIGTVKIPNWLCKHVGGELHFDWVSGSHFPDNLAEYKLVLHCGACMTNRREMLSRLMQVQEAGVPIVNYGVAIAHLHGILKRSLSPFPNLAGQL
ncbi:[FeFe] hydrogenase H-cluster maturation GTPase HydF [Desulfofalx alkaliphila]|uniref:[FeFe] hydrogenase H-cluster maturation GTPase HydF n=1 Tax=Desulfofalx alkaliphila TaxID=105483 RepID=UPI0004E1C918|nr:[FeFe] hydrogenase H-cluster maturation GTPase HydF [Desulfofalx alkaliphila]